MAYFDGVNDGASDQVKAILAAELHEKAVDLIKSAEKWVSREDLFSSIELTRHSTNRKKYLDMIIIIGWIEMENLGTPIHPKQRNKLTNTGMRLKKRLMEQE